MTLHLVRHGRPAVGRDAPARTWRLDRDHVADVTALRASGRLPDRAVWCSSPEPKALDTARVLTSGPVAVVDDLREHDREAGWLDDFDAVLARAFSDPDASAHPGWEPLRQCAVRVRAAYDAVRAEHPTAPLVLVGHATAWTVLDAHLRGLPLDASLLPRWRAQRMPDVLAVGGG